MGLMARGRGRIEFERFAAQRTDELVRTAYLMVWDLPEAEDLAQECLLRVARRWSRVRSMENPGAYARRILVNLAFDGARRRARRTQELQPRDASAEEADTGDHLDRLAVRAELLRAMATLTLRQRTILVLRYFEDLSEGQVAELLGCSAGNVKSSTARALARLREAVGPQHEQAGATRVTTPTEKEHRR